MGPHCCYHCELSVQCCLEPVYGYIYFYHRLFLGLVLVPLIVLSIGKLICHLLHKISYLNEFLCSFQFFEPRKIIALTIFAICL